MSSPRRMSVLVVPDKRYPVEHALLESIYCRELPARGHDVTWLLRSTEAQQYGERRKWGMTDVYLTPLARGTNRLSQLRNILYRKPRGALEVSRIIRERNIQLVQVRNDLYAAAGSLLACRRAGIPFVYYLAFPVQEMAIEAAKWGLTRSAYAARLYGPLALRLRNWIVRRADFVFTMSEYWREELMRELGVRGDRIKALPFGFDTSVAPGDVDGSEVRERFGLVDQPVILYFGTIARHRTLGILAEVLARVVKQVPDARMLILPSESEQQLVSHLEHEFADRGVRANAVFSRPVPHEEVMRYIAAADVGLSPFEPIPVYNVTSPAKFVEMLGMGCAVVASNTPEQSQVIREWEAGVCVPYDAGAFAEAVVRLLGDPQEAKRLGDNGRRFVEARRSFSRLADMVEETYLSVISPGGVRVAG